MTRPQRSQQAWAKWRKLIAQQAKSGHSVAAFCRERELYAPHFFQWKKRLSQEAVAKVVEVKVKSAIAPVAAAGAGIEVRLKNDIRLRVGPGFDANHLQALGSGLGEASVIGLPSLHKLDRAQAARRSIKNSGVGS